MTTFSSKTTIKDLSMLGYLDRRYRMLLVAINER